MDLIWIYRLKQLKHKEVELMLFAVGLRKDK